MTDNIIAVTSHIAIKTKAIILKAERLLKSTCSKYITVKHKNRILVKYFDIAFQMWYNVSKEGAFAPILIS